MAEHDRPGGVEGRGGGGSRSLRKRGGPRRGHSRTVRKTDAKGRPRFTGAERVLLLDSWQRSGLPAQDFADLVGLAPHTLYEWRRRFRELGPAGLTGARRKGSGSRVAEPIKRAILMLKQEHPEWGQDRIHDELVRAEGLSCSAGAIQRVLVEGGYEVVRVPTRPHPAKAKRGERARPNQLWQTDLFTFVLKRQNRRVHVSAYLDDHSRYVVGFGLAAVASTRFVIDVLEESILRFGPPEELLTDNGSQYVTWRGKSAFSKHCAKRGIKQIVSRPRHPQTLGKVERFWGSLWRELLSGAVFFDIHEARVRLGHWLDHYNFQRTHQGLGGLVPADRYFEAAPEVRERLAARVAENARALAKEGSAKKRFYLTGRVGGESLSLHAEGDRVVLLKGDGAREEVPLQERDGPAEDGEPSPLMTPSLFGGKEARELAQGEVGGPGSSPLDGVLAALEDGVAADAGEEAAEGGEGSDEDGDDADAGEGRGEVSP